MGQGEAGRNQSLGVLKNMTEMLICILGGKGNHSKGAGEEGGRLGGTAGLLSRCVFLKVDSKGRASAQWIHRGQLRKLL